MPVAVSISAQTGHGGARLPRRGGRGRVPRRLRAVTACRRSVDARGRGAHRRVRGHRGRQRARPRARRRQPRSSSSRSCVHYADVIDPLAARLDTSALRGLLPPSAMGHAMAELRERNAVGRLAEVEAEVVQVRARARIPAAGHPADRDHGHAGRVQRASRVTGTRPSARRSRTTASASTASPRTRSTATCAAWSTGARSRSRAGPPTCSSRSMDGHASRAGARGIPEAGCRDGRDVRAVPRTVPRGRARRGRRRAARRRARASGHRRVIRAR